MNGRLQHGFVTAMMLCLSPGGKCVLASVGHLFPFPNEREIVLPDSLQLIAPALTPP